MHLNVLIKKSSVSGIENENMSDQPPSDIAMQQLAEDLHPPIIKVHSTFIDNICSTDLADMQLTSKLNKGFTFLLCIADIYSKYTWVTSLKDKKSYYNY